jgi:5-formyltetrahydrofolate cyclo-ligase
MLKAEARKVFLARRKQLLEGQYYSFNQQLYHLFFTQVDLSFVKTMHIYLPIEKNHEPDTWQIIDRIRREHAHIRLCVPKVNGITNQLDNFYFEGLHQLQLNAWGIPEPQQGVPVPSKKIDMVIVPLLAFDERGNRVGYGKGFYDKFLAQCRPNCRRLGLSFFEPVDAIDDVDVSDVALTHCLTPARLVRFEWDGQKD